MGLIIGLAGTKLGAAEARWLVRRDVAGVILFTRNFSTRQQLVELVQSIRARRKDLIICVDQEGGRVQRFRPGFVDLPALQLIGDLHEKNAANARKACVLHAELMSTDILATGIDLSFAPVADLARGNLAIGNRAFSADPRACAELSTLYAHTMQQCGMPATLKHFPGHGSVLEDTHFDLAIDQRPIEQIFKQDLLPFVTSILANARAIMTAHVSYPAVDDVACGYSKRWLIDILRKQLKFRGIIFSDDVGMLGGANVGTLAERIRRHYDAGCDVVLVCAPEATAEVMQRYRGPAVPANILRLLKGRNKRQAANAIESAAFLSKQRKLSKLLQLA